MSGRNTGGLHIEVVGSHNGYGDYLRLCAEAGKPVGMVKAFFDGGVLMEAKSVSSQTVTIWRGRPLEGDSDNPHPEQDWLWPPSMNAQYADEWMTALLARWERDRAVTDYLEIVNEPNGGGLALQFENQRDFFIECMKWADIHGFKIAIGSFSSGCPEDWQTTILAPSFDYAARNGHIVALHDGSVDESRPLFSQAAVDGTAYRYRRYNAILDNLNLKRPKYAITEGKPRPRITRRSAVDRTARHAGQSVTPCNHHAPTISAISDPAQTSDANIGLSADEINEYAPRT